MKSDIGVFISGLVATDRSIHMASQEIRWASGLASHDCKEQGKKKKGISKTFFHCYARDLGHTMADWGNPSKFLPQVNLNGNPDRIRGFTLWNALWISEKFCSINVKTESAWARPFQPLAEEGRKRLRRWDIQKICINYPGLDKGQMTWTSDFLRVSWTHFSLLFDSVGSRQVGPISYLWVTFLLH